MLLEQGLLNIEQLRAANRWQQSKRPKFGILARNSGKLTHSQIKAVLEAQKLNGKLFGDTAVDLGLMDAGEVYELLRVQADFTPSLLDALLALSMIVPDQATNLATLNKTDVSVNAESLCQAVLN